MNAAGRVVLRIFGIAIGVVLGGLAIHYVNTLDVVIIVALLFAFLVSMEAKR